MSEKSNPPTRVLTTGAVRTNEQWLSELRDGESARDTTHHDLRNFIRRGLGRAFGQRRDIDDALLDDITQDAMIRVLDRLDLFRGDSRFTTWAMSIAIRVGYTLLRSRNWGDRSLEDLGLSVDARSSSRVAQADDPTDSTHRGDLLQALRDAIEQDLTSRQRTAVLGELAGMPITTLAEQLETNANALYKLHHDARLKLRAALERRGFSEADVRSILEGASNG